MKYNKTIIVVVGPTAVGKTDISIALANHFNTSIISADSRQCFIETTIGVAKPTPVELALVPHYFINSHSIQETVNAGMYEQYALEKLNTIFETKDVAVVVGGTGLYVKALIKGLNKMPKIPDEIRDNLVEQYNSNGLTWLQNEIKLKDPLFWHNAEQQNPQRLLRALEFIEATKTSIIEYRTNNDAERPFNIIEIGLQLSKQLLIDRINTRVDAMFKNGLLQEVEGLLAFKDLNALQTVGYKELFNYFNGALSLPNAIEQIKIHTRQYAKRQMTWFAKSDTINWFSAEAINLENLIFKRLEELLIENK